LTAQFESIAEALFCIAHFDYCVWAKLKNASVASMTFMGHKDQIEI